jgi:Uma2 family endonuclease
MIQALPKPVTFDEFIDWYPDSSQHRYELHNGVIVEMPLATGDHSDVAGFIFGEVFLEIRRQQLPYLVPKEYIVKSIDDKSGYSPDVLVLDRPALANEPRWKRESIITMGSSVRLAIEVVSTNWRDDYLTKLRDYEEIGIPEYWIVDFKALGGTRYIGDPKRPTLSVYELVDGEYRIKQFRDDDRIESPTFPELNLTAKQIFLANQ